MSIVYPLALCTMMGSVCPVSLCGSCTLMGIMLASCTMVGNISLCNQIMIMFSYGMMGIVSLCNQVLITFPIGCVFWIAFF